MDFKSFLLAVTQIADEKGLPKETIIETVEHALASAYKKEYGKKGQIIKAKINPETGVAEFWRIRIVVDDSMLYSEEELEKLKESPEKEEDQSKVKFNPEKHIMIDEARETEKKIKTGEELVTSLEPKQDFGRIAAQTAKQVVLQKIREAEKESVLSEYKSKEGEIISGIVQRIEGRNVYMDLGKSLGVLPKEEQVRGEFYKVGQRLKLYLLKVDPTPKGPIILLSRAYPKLISKLFELEVPEISSGQVEIKSIAREPGSRTKIAVASLAEGVDPIGAMVGQRGVRVAAVISELGGEKIDIVEYSDDPAEYLSNALAPAKVVEIKIMPKNTALAVVPDDQLSLAIGKDGQNVRLAAKLTGWKIDVKSPQQADEMPEDGETEETKEDNKEDKE